MKTAIQELLEIINHPMRPVTISAKEIVIWIINTGLEKEKEQIIEAHKIGWEDCQEYIKTIGQTTRKGKKYYNQTYNQNK